MGSIHFSLLARTSFALSRPLYELSSSAGNLRENIPNPEMESQQKKGSRSFTQATVDKKLE